jgi:hypothetical protein
VNAIGKRRDADGFLKARHHVLFAMLIVVGLLMLWALADAPLDTGQRIHGNVTGCAVPTGRVLARGLTCYVQLDYAKRVTMVLPAITHNSIIVAVEVHRITRRPYYVFFSNDR